MPSSLARAIRSKFAGETIFAVAVAALGGAVVTLLGWHADIEDKIWRVGGLVLVIAGCYVLHRYRKRAIKRS